MSKKVNFSNTNPPAPDGKVPVHFQADTTTHEVSGYTDPAESGAVRSVAGRTGDVVLSESDISGLSADLAAKASTSYVNSQDAAVLATAEAYTDGHGGAPPSFDEVESGTNTTAAMVVGSGASLTRTGTGHIDADKVAGVIYGGSPSHEGQIPIVQPDMSVAFADPLVQGLVAEGVAVPNPVVIGGKDGSGNNKALVLDASGRPTVNVNGTVPVTATVAGVATAANQASEISSLAAIAASVATIPASPATAGNQSTGNASLASIDVKTPTLSGGKVPVTDPTALPLPSGASTAAKQPALGTAGTPSSDVISVQGKVGMTAVVVDGSGVTQPVSASSLPLPAGASTAAKQPALGTAGTPASDVITIQGKAAMTPVLIDGTGTTQPISAAALPLPSGAATAAKQPALGTAGTPSSDVISIQGAASMTAVKVDGSAVTQPVSLAANQSVNNAQVSGTAIDVNSGVKGAGTMRVVLATDQPALTNKILVTPDANSAVNVSQVNGVTPLMGAGNTGTGSPRVTIASDQAAVAIKTPAPQTSGGYSVATGTIGATATAVKASPGQVYGIDIFNSNLVPVYVQFFNVVPGSVTLGTTAPFLSIGIPAGQALPREWMAGLPFSTVITIAITTGRSNAGAPVNTVDYNVEYQ